MARLPLAGALGVMAPPVAATLVLAGGWMTPGYDPFTRTISRLSVPGAAGGLAVEVAIVLVGGALVALAVALGPGLRVGRALLAVAAGGLLMAAAIRLDPASVSATAGHRLATMLAMLALAGAPFAFGSYGRMSFAFGAAEVGMLLVGLALLPTTFAAWGAWERCLLVLPMAWMLVLSWRLLRAEGSSLTISVSTDDTMKAAAASRSSSGS